MRKKITIGIIVCILFTISFFSGCINVPKELTQFSIVSFDVEPGIINQGEFANLSWVVLSASSVNIDNGIGNVALMGHRIIHPTQTTTYILTASNATTTKSATATITIKPVTVKPVVNATISDGMGDVTSIDYLTGETKVVLNHPDINVYNLDIIKVTYIQQGKQATILLQVKGSIENRGKIIDPYSDDFFSTFNTVEYELLLSTSEEDYSISYSNNTCMLSYGIQQINLASSDFSVVGNTLTISFTLTITVEIYSDLSVSSTYTNFIYDKEEPFIELLSDVAPNPPLAVYDAYASNIGSVGESIQFNGSVEPLTGTPPYKYRWNFGDGSSSTLQNPTHSYTKVGVFTYTFTVTDNVGAIASLSGGITISIEAGSTKAPNMAFNKQTSLTKQLILVSADPGLLWEDFAITGAVAPTGTVLAGDVIALPGTTGTITIRHIPTNTLMGTWTWV